MASLPKILGARGRFLLLVLTLLLLTDLAILLDVPVLRQVLGFTFFTFVPGLLIIYILKLNRLKLTETVVLSVGLSISFLIFFGLLIDGAYFSLGYATPLSTKSLVISFSVILIILGIIGYKRNREAFSFHLSDFKLNTKEKAFLLLPAFFPLLSIQGMNLMNATGNNVVLMLLLSLIPAYVIFIAISNRQVPQRTYPLIIFLTGISLLLLLSLRSSHIIGSDVHFTYNLFQLTSDGQHWGIFYGTPYDTCLSINLLPTVYQSLLNIDSEYLFKILYSLLFSISPLVIYIISRKYIGNFYAFLASFFFMSQYTFLWTAFVARTNTAILFFALAIMVLFHDGISEAGKRALFIVFAASTIVSHYSTTYIFLFILLLAWMAMQILPKIALRKRKSATLSENPTALENPVTPQSGPPVKSDAAVEIPKPRFKKSISITMVGLFLAMLFLWYSQLTQASFSFSYGVGFIHRTLINLSNFFILEAWGEQMGSRLFGMGLMHEEIPQIIEFIFTWLTPALVAIGVLIAIRRYKRMVSIPDSGGEKAGLLQRKFDTEYFALSLACSLILIAIVIVPGLGEYYALSQSYLQMMVVLSVFFVIGGVTVAKFLKLRHYWVMLAVVIPFFMCMSGTMYQIFNVPKNIVLNSEGTQYNYYYIHEQDSYAAKWLHDNGKLENITIYPADSLGERLLRSQGGISLYSHSIDGHSFREPDEEIAGGYIYLRYFNVIDGKLLDDRLEEHDIIEFQDKLAGKDKIYSNGGSEIWR